MRAAKIERKTTETDIVLRLDIDGAGGADENKIATGVGFFDHMLTLFARHGRFALSVTCSGDTDVDFHHTVEDVGLCLGDAFNDALSTRAGITRYGDATLPMDEALVLAAVDISGRGYLGYDMGDLPDKTGEFDTDLAREFWAAFTRRAGITLHLRKLAGGNAHHVLEAGFKAAARALRIAAGLDAGGDGSVPSTKGVL